MNKENTILIPESEIDKKPDQHSDEEFASGIKKEQKRIISKQNRIIAEKTSDMYFGGLMSE